MSQEPALKLPPFNEVLSDKKSRLHISRPERQLHVPGLNLTEPVNNRFASAVNYRNYHILNKSSLYEDDVAQELQKMAKKIALQMEDHTFCRKAATDVGYSKNAGNRLPARVQIGIWCIQN